jgi:hypothetical protein
MKHITTTSKTHPALAVESWWQEAIDKIACVVDPDLEKCR